MVARNCDLCCSARSSCQPFSRISLIRRTFSMAIAAWSANTVASSICLAEKGSTLSRASASTPISWPSRVIGRPSIVPSRRTPVTSPLRSLGRGVGDGDRASAARDTDDEVVPGRRGGRGGGQQVVLRRPSGGATGHPAEGAVLELIDAGHLRPAQPGRGVEDDLQHRREVEGRAADRLQHVGDRGLVVERFAQLGGAFGDLALEVDLGSLLGRGEAIEQHDDQHARGGQQAGQQPMLEAEIVLVLGHDVAAAHVGGGGELQHPRHLRLEQAADLHDRVGVGQPGDHLVDRRERRLEFLDVALEVGPFGDELGRLAGAQQDETVDQDVEPRAPPRRRRRGCRAGRRPRSSPPAAAPRAPPGSAARSGCSARRGRGPPAG